jgi:hypothetical protein
MTTTHDAKSSNDIQASVLNAVESPSKMTKQEDPVSSSSSESDKTSEIPVITDYQELLRYGVCQVPIPIEKIDLEKWATELSKVTPLNMAGEGDGEYAFYRNILDEEDFPFEAFLNEGRSSDIAKAILVHFGVTTLTEIRLDDAFCVHYNMNQGDTSGAKHIDPSDITVNMCFEKSDDAQGSHVMFYGTKKLHGEAAMDSDTPKQPDRFLVTQEPGFATIHWGDHPHETMPLLNGKRTNIVFTYCYSDASRSDVAMRNCYT